jgi:hypothetical protein
MGTWDEWATSTKDPRSSNWRELRTLVEVLRCESTETSRFRLQCLLYFTDNMVTYHIVALVKPEKKSIPKRPRYVSLGES